MTDKWHEFDQVLRDYVRWYEENELNYTKMEVFQIFNHKQFYSVLFFIAALITVISGVGIVTNIINIYVFLKANVRGSVDVCLLALSITDFGSSVSNFIWGISKILITTEIYIGPFMKVTDPEVIEFYADHLNVAFYTTSCLTTLYIALARCACVLWPLQFKNMFTAKRSIGFITIAVLFALGTKLPSTAHSRVVQKFIPLMNASRSMSSHVKGRGKSKNLATWIHYILLPFITQGMIIICVILISFALKKSVKFRRAAEASKSAVETGKDKGKLSAKELTVVKQVLLLCVVYLSCNIPKITVGSLGYFVRKGNQKNVYARAYKLMHPGRIAFESLNSTVNIAVYLKYNEKYRKAFNTYISTKLSPYLK